MTIYIREKYFCNGSKKNSATLSFFVCIAITLASIAHNAQGASNCIHCSNSIANASEPSDDALQRMLNKWGFHTAPRGYLSTKEPINFTMLLPLPPTRNSTAQKLDEYYSRETALLRGTSRWMLATKDAVPEFAPRLEMMSCALHANITEHDTPHIYNMLSRSLVDTWRALLPAKEHYRRPRPFFWNKEPICIPKQINALGKNGSYPSGHSAAGWAWALILAEISPENANAILARGKAYGDSRVVCNVHWHSDVVEGRIIGAAIVAQMHANPEFQADIAASRAELAAVRAKNIRPAHDCKSEAATLALKPSAF